jgi:hypothetical protein
MRHLLVALLATLTSSAALAQAAEPQPPASEAAPSAPADAPAAPEADSAPGVDERVTNAEGKITSIEEQLSEAKTDLGILKRLKFSGYVQARYQYVTPLEDETGGSSRFFIRRSRLKATYSGDVGQFMLQIDATTATVGLRDVEALLYIPGTQQRASISVGQFKWPFGYETVQSSVDRELPERSLVVQRFMPTERDLGARVNVNHKWLRFAAGVFNGNGTVQRDFIGVDNDKEKDLVGRLGFDLKWLSGGISGWYGHTLGMGPGDTFRRAYDRTRFALDVQVYGDVLPVGATALKAEYITGKTYLVGGREQLGVPASGWYALLVQNLGLSNALAVRYDYFDPVNGLGPEAADATHPAATNAVGTLGIAALHYFGETVKATLTYEIPMTATPEGLADPRDNALTFQLQARY